MTATREAFTEARRDSWTRQHQRSTPPSSFARAYHDRMETIYSHNLLHGSRVLEIGCGKGDLLAKLEPAEGVGVDFCAKAIESAQRSYPGFQFHCMDAHDLGALGGTFDYIILSDLINDVYDVEEVLRQVARLCNSDTRLLINFYSQLWSGILHLAQRTGLATKLLRQNWLSEPDLDNLLRLTGFETVRSSEEIVLPARLPYVANALNRLVPRIWPLHHLALSHFVVARPVNREATEAGNCALASVSIVVAARNESGHVGRLIDQIPLLGDHTEVIFVEGGSSDDTYEEIERNLNRREDISLSLYRQPGKGKADAVRLGFDKAKNDILMILDADISVMPIDLTRFHRAITENRGEFINGVRLVYPMEDKAMRFLNLLGNKFFAYGFRFALGQTIKDTLCGTKVISRANYRRLVSNRHYFGDFDPFGDFDLIFGAAKLNLKIVDVPVRYQARQYGETNINRWSGGWLLLRMLLRSLRKIKFV